MYETVVVVSHHTFLQSDAFCRKHGDEPIGRMGLVGNRENGAVSGTVTVWYRRTDSRFLPPVIPALPG
jgi:hypothetical protein